MAREAAVAALQGAALGDAALQKAEDAAVAACRLRVGLEAALHSLQGISLEQSIPSLVTWLWL